MLFPWQNEDFYKLANSFINGSFHALLVYGGARTGSRELISELLQFMLCQNKYDLRACKQCNSCVLFTENNHPDLYLLAADDSNERKTSTIKVEQIREATDFSYRSLHLSNHKVIFIPSLEELTVSSANALLKVLEEPPSRCIFVLQSIDLSRVLPTIKSRCFKFGLTKPSYNDAIQNLSDIPDAEFWLRYYDGEPLFEVPFTVEQKNIFINTLQTPSIVNIFNLTKEIDPKKVGIGIVLDFFLKWLCDLIQVVEGAEASYFIENTQTMQSLVTRINKDKFYNLQQEVVFLIEWSNHPLNHKLQLENILLKYQQIYV